LCVALARPEAETAEPRCGETAGVGFPGIGELRSLGLVVLPENESEKKGAEEQVNRFHLNFDKIYGSYPILKFRVSNSINLTPVIFDYRRFVR
jgi:hypothetical protein